MATPDYPRTADRTRLLLKLCIVRDQNVPIVPTQKRAVGDAYATGAVLTEVEGNYAAALPSPIDANADGPVRYLALEDFDGESTDDQSVITVQRSTRLTGQIASGSATEDDIGRQGRLIGSATTGLYEVNLDATDAPSVEITSVEPLDYPWEPRANGDYNLVEFKFLPAVLDIAPASLGS